MFCDVRFFYNAYFRKGDKRAESGRMQLEKNKCAMLLKDKLLLEREKIQYAEVMDGHKIDKSND